MLDLQGDAAGALTIRRQLELEAMDASLRPLQELVNQLTDAKAAAEAAAQAQTAAAEVVSKARSTLTTVYAREAGALKDTIKTFSDFGASLRAFRAGLYAADQGTGDAYRQTQVKFLTTAALAQAKDTKALGELADAGKAFLDASRSQATSALQYQRDVAFVARSVDLAIGAADDAVSIAQQQLDAMTDQVSELVDLNETAISLVDAMQAVRSAIDAQAAASRAPITSIAIVPIGTPAAAIVTAPAASSVSSTDTSAADSLEVLLAIKQDMGDLRRRVARIVTDDGMLVRADADAPLLVKTVP